MSEDWHCARCLRRSGMYGHSGPNGWYCHEANELTDVQRERCQEFDRKVAERQARMPPFEPEHFSGDEDASARRRGYGADPPER